MIYIIDGYNVMHVIEQGDGIAAADLDEKRRRFIEQVISHATVTGDKTTIVFDSALAKSPAFNSINGSDVAVVFASASESADIIIGKLVQQNLAASSERIRVVSADWEVQKGAMQARVERIPPRYFIAEMKSFVKRLANDPEMGRIRWKLEHKLDVETLRKLERMRREGDGGGQ
jgi:predicted RNA-binding protein with PIN domain